MAKKRSERPHATRLIDSERRFRLLVEGVTDYAIYMLDPSGIITNWNAGAERIKGYSADEIVGRHFSIFHTPEDRAAGMPDRALAIARSEGKYEAEGWRVRKDGSRFFASVVIDPIYENEELIGFAKITRDISERQSSRRALQDSQAQFKLLVSAVTDYALYLLDPEGNVSSWNAGGERIKGYAPQEIIGQHFSRFYTPSDQAAGRPARALEIARTVGRYDEEGLRVRKDGSFFWASVVIDPIRDDDGKLIGYAKITRDITERREAQASLEKMQRQLAEFAEDGCARPAHGRRGARFQQFAHDRIRSYSNAKEICRSGFKSGCGGPGHRACDAARCGIDAPTADVFEAPACKSGTRRFVGKNSVDPRSAK